MAGRSWRRRRRQWRRQACWGVASKLGQAPGIAPPRETTLPANTAKRGPSRVASRARARWVPCQRLRPQLRRGTTPGATARAWRWVPCVAWAASPHSRHGGRTLGALRGRPVARQTLTALSAHERAKPLPRRQRANTVAWGVRNRGHWVWLLVVPSSTRVRPARGASLAVWGSWRPPAWSTADGLAPVVIPLLLNTYPSEPRQGGRGTRFARQARAEQSWGRTREAVRVQRPVLTPYDRPRNALHRDP
jgi:hypothetical protein